MNKLLCPLCRTTAEATVYLDRKRKHFKCSVCGEFVITERAEGLLIRSTIESTLKLSATAREAEAGGLLFIFTVPTPPQENRSSVEAEYLPLEEALRR